LRKILFISLAVVFALSIGLIGCEGEGEPPDVWDSEIELTLHPTISQFASICELVIFPWVDEVHTLEGPDGGTFNITIVTPGDSPYDAASSLTAITLATTDIGMLSPETFHLGGAGYLPFEFDSIEQTAYVMYKLWTASPSWDENNQLGGVKILFTMPLWGSQLWTTLLGGNVTQAADMSGLLIRSDAQAVESDTLQALGAVPTFLGVSELAGSLQNNTINGCFFTYSGIGGAADLGGVTNYTTELNMIYRPYSLAMNLDVYNDLPTDDKDALDSVTGLDASVAWATAHLAGEADDKDQTINGPCFFPGPTCYPQYGRTITYPDLGSFVTATAGVAGDWGTYMTDTLEYDGAGILAAIDTLKAEYDAL
jgi:TRAP-type C4-dicarboxylate transport system substrate-binding protein